MGKAVGKGLKMLHARNIVHKDIKPQNILMMEDGSIKVSFYLSHSEHLCKRSQTWASLFRWQTQSLKAFPLAKLALHCTQVQRSSSDNPLISKLTFGLLAAYSTTWLACNLLSWYKRRKTRWRSLTESDLNANRHRRLFRCRRIPQAAKVLIGDKDPCSLANKCSKR